MDFDDGIEKVNRHWSATSQTYAPVDVLLQYLCAGWTLESTVAFEEFCCGGARYVKVYYFRLRCEEKNLWMPVLENPIVLQLIHDYALKRSQVAQSQCEVCDHPSVEPDPNRRYQNGCTCAQNSTLHCCCTSRLLF